MMPLAEFSTLNSHNITDAIDWYHRSIVGISVNTPTRGIELFEMLKRQPVGCGPYPVASYFEAANRIMTDLVILHGVHWLLQNHPARFDAFTVDYGHHNSQAHDVMSVTRPSAGPAMDAEAFNVAPSFFQLKKSRSLAKLRQRSHANHKLILVNADAVPLRYSPKLRSGEGIVLVDIHGETTRLVN